MKKKFLMVLLTVMAAFAVFTINASAATDGGNCGRALSPPAVPDRRRLQSAGGERNMLNDIQKSILQTVSDMVSIPDGAVNIRLDGQKEFRQNSEHIQIVSKTDKDGIDIRIAPFTKSENVHIPVILSKSGFHDLVYNDFFVGEGADVTIVAGCGIHNCGDCDSEHDGIHTFYIGKNAKVHYIEKHYGEGEGSGKRILNPQTIVYLEEGASIVMDTSRIGGIHNDQPGHADGAGGGEQRIQRGKGLPRLDRAGQQQQPRAQQNDQRKPGGDNAPRRLPLKKVLDRFQN